MALGLVSVKRNNAEPFRILVLSQRLSICVAGEISNLRDPFAVKEPNRYTLGDTFKLFFLISVIMTLRGRGLGP